MPIELAAFTDIEAVATDAARERSIGHASRACSIGWTGIGWWSAIVRRKDRH